MTIPTIHAKARDITLKFDIDLEDSCKCPSNCCFSIGKTTLNPHMEVYVSALGEVQKLDMSQFLNTQDARDRCMQNLEMRVRQIARHQMKDEEKAVQQILTTYLQDKNPLTVSKIERINDLIMEYLA